MSGAAESDCRDIRSVAGLCAWLREELSVLLECPAESIRDHETFARYGVDSLRATTLASKLSEALGRSVPVALLWAYPSLAALSAHLLDRPGGEAGTRHRDPGSPAAVGHEPIAVVGMACRFPMADNTTEFWELLLSATDTVGAVPPGRWDPADFVDPDPSAPAKMMTDRAGYLRGRLDEFDPLFFGISPREAAEMDPQQRLFLEVAWEALENAGMANDALAGSRTGVFAGVIWHDYAELAAPALHGVVPHSATGRALGMVANRLSYVLGLRGPSVAVDTACSASLYALHLACQSLWLGESTAALAGGVNLLISPGTSVALSKFGGLSPDGRCKSFDARADGYGRGEGCGVVVLKRLSRALADGDDIWCLVPGSAANNDGLSNGLTAPNPLAQEEVLRDAYQRAGVRPGEVHFIETHGTGTALGDPIEAAALSAVLSEGRPADAPLILGAVKTNIGHLEGAAGIAGFIKTALALRHRRIPRNLHFERPNPHIDFEGLGLRVPRDAEPWPEDRAPLAGVSSFGWGGTNVHVVMEGWREPAPLPATVPGRPRETPEAAVPSPRPVFVCSPHGQQWAGMGRRLFRTEPVFRRAVERCDAALLPHTGWSVVDALFPAGDTGRTDRADDADRTDSLGPNDTTARTDATDRLDRVDVAQPVLFAVQIGIAAWLEAAGARPHAVVGTCFSEITAAVIAGILDLPDGARLVHHYSRAQSRVAGRGGAMAVAELPPEELAEYTTDTHGLSVAGLYGPRSTALAGHVDALRTALAAWKSQGVLCGMVRIDAAVHSPDMDPVLAELESGSAGITPRPGRIPMVSAVTGAPVEWREITPGYFARGLRQPVRLTEAVAHLATTGHGPFVEISAHPVLLHALRQHVTAIGTMRRGRDDREGLRDALEELARAGVPVTGPGAGDRGGELFTLSAATPEALRELARSTAAPPVPAAPAALRDLAHTAARRTHHAWRLAVVARDTDELGAALSAFARGEEPAGLHASTAPVVDPPKVAFVFPGQGSQWIGMGRELAGCEPEFHAALRQCDDAVGAYAGWSVLDELVADERHSRLARIDVVQPMLFSIEVALAALWRSWGVVPDAVIGHSMGEIAAAHVAGALGLEDAVRIICGRSALLRRVSGQGAMLAAELTMEEALRAVEGHEESVAVAVSNSPRSTVLSGDERVLTDISRELDRADVFWRWVKVDVASHSPQMDPLREDLLATLRGISPRSGTVPLYSTVTGEPASGESLDAHYWVRNLRDPVLFSDQIGRLLRDDVGAFVEMSPHPVLVPTVGQSIAHAGDNRAQALPSLRRHEGERAVLLESLGRLHVLGCRADMDRANSPGRHGAPLPAYPWQRDRHWPDHLTFGAPAAPSSPPGPAAGPGLDDDPTATARATAGEPASPEETAEERVRRHVARVAKIAAARIDAAVPLRSYGIDSVMSLELRNRLEGEFGVSLSATVVWNHPTVAGLADHLARLTGPRTPGGPAAGATEEPGSAGREPDDTGHEGLSPEELLDRELAELNARLETL
ncbi:acyltransferase domain-containing protein [Streptomyces syringium]|uniref:acyltransferase domain-containing protein n=1 Tax=Streptomyces syringium TaxID=76729 RepID=UPI00341C9FB1